MLANSEKLDLCSTCNDTLICSPNSRRPVLFCEQFDDFVPAAKKKIEQNPQVVVKIDAKKDSENHKFLGLCINCDLRNECIRAKQEGGVWHCEEYR